jgi:osmoprotectant transport system permease protein
MAESIDWDWIDRHTDDIVELTQQHAEIVATSVTIAIVIALPLAILVRRGGIPYVLAAQGSTILYTIPSLALFAVLVPIVGIGRTPAVIGLVAYAMLILIENTVVGLRGVPPPVREAARGMGMTSWQILLRVELPMALPSILTGIRLATVSTVGIATIAVLVGAGGLGVLIFNDGIQRGLFLTPIVVGAVCATVLALVLDGLLAGLGWAASGWKRAGR